MLSEKSRLLAHEIKRRILSLRRAKTMGLRLNSSAHDRRYSSVINNDGDIGNSRKYIYIDLYGSTNRQMDQRIDTPSFRVPR